jgi:hypothetical protein
MVTADGHLFMAYSKDVRARFVSAFLLYHFESVHLRHKVRPLGREARHGPETSVLRISRCLHGSLRLQFRMTLRKLQMPV